MKVTLKKQKNVKAGGMNLETAKAVLEDGRTFDITYDWNERNLIVHRWYRMEEEEHRALRATLEEYYAERLKRESGGAA